MTLKSFFSFFAFVNGVQISPPANWFLMLQVLLLYISTLVNAPTYLPTYLPTYHLQDVTVGSR